MNLRFFLIRVNPELWQFKDKNKDWESIDEGDWVPFWSGHKHKKDIEKIRMRDIVVGYSCYEPKQCIESLGRVVSGNLFEYLDGKRFLVQKTTQLKCPISREVIREIIEDPRLKLNRPTVTLMKQDDWEKIKELIIRNNPEAAGDIIKLEQGNDDW